MQSFTQAKKKFSKFGLNDGLKDKVLVGKNGMENYLFSWKILWDMLSYTGHPFAITETGKLHMGTSISFCLCPCLG